MSARAVYVRGVGAVTPLGASWQASLAALASGKSAVAQVTEFDVQGFPCTVAAAVPSPLPSCAEYRCPTSIDLDCAPNLQLDRRLALLLPAALEAWQAAMVSAPATRIGVYLGAESGRAPLQSILALSRAAGGGTTFDHQQFGQRARALTARIDASVVSPAAVASTIAKLFGAEGPVQTLSLACASGLSAVIEGARAIRCGVVDVAICGGVGADVEPLMLAGFGKLGALSARGSSCPFDVRRDGFVVGEGAAAVVLAAARGNARVEVLGGGRSLDAYHLTAPDPQGLGAERAMRAALKEAELTHVDYVQAHGTSTPLNDAVEASVLQRIFGASTEAGMPLVSSVKGAVGHWIAGAGAIGLLCAVEAIDSGLVLPTAGLQRPDPKCDLPHVIGHAQQHNIRAAMVNALAFGGANSSLVVGRCR